MAENQAHLSNRRFQRRAAQLAEVNEQEGTPEDQAFEGNVTMEGTLGVTGQATLDDADLGGIVGFGAAEEVTIASGVATVTKSYVRLDAEGAGTTDQLDTITMDGAADGDLLLLVVNATDTITVDDANINLGAATRAIAPGGSLLLVFDGTEWTELHFTAATDNA